MRTIAIIVTLVALLVGAGCANREAQRQARQTEQLVSDPTRPVRVVPVVTATLERTEEITGSITAGEDVLIGAKIGGRLVEVLVKDGQSVRAGQVIAQQETEELLTRLRQAQEGARAAESQVDQAATDAQVAPRRSAAAIAAARAQLRQAEEQLRKLRAGARPEERIQMQWRVENAKKNLDQAQADFDRAKRLRAEGAISPSEAERFELALMNARTAYESVLQDERIMNIGARQEDIAAAEQQVEAAREQVRLSQANQDLDKQFKQRIEAAMANLRASQEQVSLARQALADATIRAPFAGTISGRPAQVGAMLAPGAPVARLVAVDGLYFEGDVPEAMVSSLRVGSTVRVRIAAVDRAIPGLVAAMNPIASETARLFKVRIMLTESPAGLKAGMFARGSVSLGSIPRALVIPEQAVLTVGELKRVFVVEAGKARGKVVRVGVAQDGLVQIVSGLRLGERVVVRGQDQLSEGTPVKIESGDDRAARRQEK
jgi:RND family efflux transporter MFP subunit